MKRYIVCQSKKKSDIGSDLDNQTPSCMECLAQLWLFYNYKDYLHHWSQEVWLHFKRIPRNKSNNKFPSANFIFENTYEFNKNYLPVAIDSAIYHEKDLNPDKYRLKHFELFKSIVEDYFIWLSENLSKKGSIKFSDVQTKLKELILL